MAELLPCPFCGSIRIFQIDGSTFRWMKLQCADCEASCGEIRREGDPSHPALTQAWNTRASAEWQPIETAPKMRTVILWADTSYDGVSNWRMGSGHFHTGIGAWIWEGEQVKEGWAHPPTHWMPLPSPPEATTRKESE